MAQLAFGVAGAAIGSALGPISVLGLSFSGTSLGFSIGSALGGYFFGGADNDTTITNVIPTQEGPRLGESRILTSSFGAPIPKIYGTMRVAGNVIWEGPVIERRIETTQTASSTSVSEGGGKGGGGGSSSVTTTTSQTTITYKYNVDIAIAICEGPIAGIRRIWADSAIIYDISSGRSAAAALASASIAAGLTIYYGTESQGQDPVMSAWIGQTFTSPHRGLAYIVINDFEITPYGNRIPQLEFEVFASGVSTLNLESAGQFFSFAPNVPAGSQNLMRAGAKSGYIDPNGTETYGLAEASATDASLLRLWRYNAYASSAAVNGSSAYYEFTLPWPLANTGTPAVLEPLYQVSGSNATVRRVYLANSVNAYTLVSDTEFTAFDQGILYIDLVDRISFVLLHSVPRVGNFRGRVSTSAARWGPHMYAVVDSAAGPVANVGIYYWNLASVQNGQQVQGTLIFSMSATAVLGVILNADSRGWFFNDYFTTGPNGRGLFAYSHTSAGTLQFSYPEPVGIVPYRIDPANNTMIGLGSTQSADLEYMIDATQRGILDNDLLVYASGQAPAGSYNPSAGLMLSNNRPTGATAGNYQWAVVTSGSPSDTSLQAIAEDLMSRTGMGTASYDMSAGASTVVKGYMRANVSTIRTNLEALAAAFLFDIVETGAQLKLVPWGNGGTFTIDPDDLGYHEYGEEVVEEIETIIGEEIVLPRRITVKFYNPNRSLQQGSYHIARESLVTRIRNEINIELPISMTASQAYSVAYRLLNIAWLERRSHKFSVSLKHVGIEPGDIITIQGTTYTSVVKVANVNHRLPNLIDVSGTAYSVPPADLVAVDPETEEEVEPEVPGPTLLYMLDAPLLRPGDDATGIYATALGPTSGWRGAVVFRSFDEGVSWDATATILSDTFVATVDGVLPDVSNPHVWDRTTSLTLKSQDPSKTLASTTEAAVFSGGNAALVGQPGRWEIVGFVTATDNGDDTWTISQLLRGRGGTDQYVGDHVDGDLFIVIDPNAFVRIGIIDTLIGTDVLFRGVSLGTSIVDAQNEMLTFEAVSNKPWSPTFLKGSRDGSNNLTLSWLRRSRIVTRQLWSPTLGEDSESYSIDILDAPGGNVVATYSSTSESFLYTAAQQTTDGFTPGNAITFKVYQLSATVGRGTGTEATV